MKITHDELVIRAALWLKNTFHCGVVLRELVAYTNSGETPDAIGWVHNQAILVECKANRADFRAEQKKRARHYGMSALGAWRFYLTPPSLIRSDEMLAGWGLYEVHGRSIVHKAGSEYSNGAMPPFGRVRG
jgi:hypothetical protein